MGKITSERSLSKRWYWYRPDVKALPQATASHPTLIVSGAFFLGGKSRSDPDRWQPDMKAVFAVIRYAIATGRLEPEPESESLSTQ